MMLPGALTGLSEKSKNDFQKIIPLLHWLNTLGWIENNSKMCIKHCSKHTCKNQRHTLVVLAVSTGRRIPLTQKKKTSWHEPNFFISKESTTLSWPWRTFFHSKPNSKTATENSHCSKAISNTFVKQIGRA